MLLILFDFKYFPLIAYRLQDPKKAVDRSKLTASRIADKISLFEQQKQDRCDNRTFQTPRSADVSPSRKVADRFKADCLLLERRSRSAERTARSSSSSPAREKPMTIKERVRRILEAEGKAAATQVPAKTGISQKSTSSVGVASSMLLELDNQAKLDTKEQTHTKPNSGPTSKPDRKDNSADVEQISTPEVQVFDSKTKEKVVSKTANQDTKPNSVEKAEDADDSSDLTNTTIPHPKGPNRSGSHSKKRKSKEPKSPISPNVQNKPKVTDIKKEQNFF